MIISDNQEIEQMLARMADEIKTQKIVQNSKNPLMIGIHTGGVWVAKRLHQLLKLTDPLGTLDISFYRDDFTRVGINPQVKPSKLPFSVEDKHIVLVDDVLHTGRTIRAALNEIFDYGRPASVLLVVLTERSGRELPIQADVVGKHLKLSDQEHAKLSQDEAGEFTLQIMS